MYKQISELKFFIAKNKEDNTHKIKATWIEIWDGMEQIGIADSMQGAFDFVDSYLEEIIKE